MKTTTASTQDSPFLIDNESGEMLLLHVIDCLPMDFKQFKSTLTKQESALYSYMVCDYAETLLETCNDMFDQKLDVNHTVNRSVVNVEFIEPMFSFLNYLNRTHLMITHETFLNNVKSDDNTCKTNQLIIDNMELLKHEHATYKRVIQTDYDKILYSTAKDEFNIYLDMVALEPDYKCLLTDKHLLDYVAGEL